MLVLVWPGTPVLQPAGCARCKFVSDSLFAHLGHERPDPRINVGKPGIAGVVGISRETMLRGDFHQLPLPGSVETVAIIAHEHVEVETRRAARCPTIEE